MLHVLHILHHRVDGPNDTPCFCISLDLRSRGGIRKAAQLGQYPNAKAAWAYLCMSSSSRRGGVVNAEAQRPLLTITSLFWRYTMPGRSWQGTSASSLSASCTKASAASPASPKSSSI